MNICVAIFCYNRSLHIKRVLDAVKKNTVMPQEFILIQDGIKEKCNTKEWDEVNRLIYEIELPRKRIIVSDENIGCKSVGVGVSKIINSYDGLIVLEDDCVPNIYFFQYMIDCLQKYRNEKKVYCIGGYARDVGFEPEDDVYFSGRSESWGWATWPDRWEKFSFDYGVLKEIRNDKEAKERLSIWGPDLSNMLADDLLGKVDAWDVFWALQMIKNDGLCVYPKKSLIRNIGLDGTGTHCGISSPNIDYLNSQDVYDFRFPEVIEVKNECKKAFSKYYSYTDESTRRQMYVMALCSIIRALDSGESIEEVLVNKKILVYGIGEIADLLDDLFGSRIVGFIQTYPTSKSYRGKPIMSISDVGNDVSAIIVIPIFDIEMIRQKMSGVVDCIIGINELFKNDCNL